MKWIWALLVFAVVSGCVVIAVTLLELQEPSPISPAMLPVDHNDVAHHGASVNRQRFILVRTVLAHASEPSTFVNPNSPQTAALKWLAYQDQIVDLILPSENATLDVALSVFNESAYRWKLEQRYALMVLSFSTNGEAWRNVVPWAYHVETDECTASFQGVGCDFSSGRVTQVVLSNRLIGGHLPEEIALLTELTILDFSRNLLEGQIPHSVYTKLTKLEHLSLTDNEIAFPLRDEIGSLVKLKSLSISKTHISGSLPRTMANLTRLKELKLTKTMITGDLIMVAASIPGLRSLEVQAAEGLTGTIPTEVGLASNLAELIVAGTGMDGPLPSEFGQLTNLRRLILNGHFTGNFPWELTQCTNLISMILSFTPGLHGEIPSTIGDLSVLTTLAMATTSMGGTLPTEMGLLTRLETLNLENSLFQGAIPSEMGMMRALNNFRINSNYLTGTFPQAICDIDNIYVSLNCITDNLVCENDCCPVEWCSY